MLHYIWPALPATAVWFPDILFCCCFVLFCFRFLFIYSWETERERGRGRACREPDMGLDLRSLGSGPGLKAALNCWATQAAPRFPVGPAISQHHPSPREVGEENQWWHSSLTAGLLHLLTTGLWGTSAKRKGWGCLSGSAMEHLPLVQVVILGS